MIQIAPYRLSTSPKTMPREIARIPADAAQNEHGLASLQQSNNDIALNVSLEAQAEYAAYNAKSPGAVNRTDQTSALSMKPIKNDLSPDILAKAYTEAKAAYAAGEATALKGTTMCKTCESRVYVDGSDDPSVSFQTPTRINPEAALSAVSAHEGEHVANEQIKASREGNRIINQSVSIHTSICSECGRTYVSGGEARTLVAVSEDAQPQAESKEKDYNMEEV